MTTVIAIKRRWKPAMCYAYGWIGTPIPEQISKIKDPEATCHPSASQGRRETGLITYGFEESRKLRKSKSLQLMRISRLSLDAAKLVAMSRSKLDLW